MPLIPTDHPWARQDGVAAAAAAAVETTSAAMAARRQVSHDAVRRSQGVHRVTLNRLG
jgi:hypothetical protein